MADCQRGARSSEDERATRPRGNYAPTVGQRTRGEPLLEKPVLSAQQRRRRTRMEVQRVRDDEYFSEIFTSIIVEKTLRGFNLTSSKEIDNMLSFFKFLFTFETLLFAFLCLTYF